MFGWEFKSQIFNWQWACRFFGLWNWMITIFLLFMCCFLLEIILRSTVDSQIYVSLSYHTVYMFWNAMPCFSSSVDWEKGLDDCGLWMTNVAMTSLLLNAFTLPLLAQAVGWVAREWPPTSCYLHNEGQMSLLWGRNPAVHSPTHPKTHSVPPSGEE